MGEIVVQQVVMLQDVVEEVVILRIVVGEVVILQLVVREIVVQQVVMLQVVVEEVVVLQLVVGEIVVQQVVVEEVVVQQIIVQQIVVKEVVVQQIVVQRIAKPVSSERHSTRFFFPRVEHSWIHTLLDSVSPFYDAGQSWLRTITKITSHYIPQKYPSVLTNLVSSSGQVLVLYFCGLPLASLA